MDGIEVPQYSTFFSHTAIPAVIYSNPCDFERQDRKGQISSQVGDDQRTPAAVCVLLFAVRPRGCCQGEGGQQQLRGAAESGTADAGSEVGASPGPPPTRRTFPTHEDERENRRAVSCASHPILGHDSRRTKFPCDAAVWPPRCAGRVGARPPAASFGASVEADPESLGLCQVRRPQRARPVSAVQRTSHCLTGAPLFHEAAAAVAHRGRRD